MNLFFPDQIRALNGGFMVFLELAEKQKIKI